MVTATGRGAAAGWGLVGYIFVRWGKCGFIVGGGGAWLGRGCEGGYYVGDEDEAL